MGRRKGIGVAWLQIHEVRCILTWECDVQLQRLVEVALHSYHIDSICQNPLTKRTFRLKPDSTKEEMIATRITLRDQLQRLRQVLPGAVDYLPNYTVGDRTNGTWMWAPYASFLTGITVFRIKDQASGQAAKFIGNRHVPLLRGDRRLLAKAS
jgi:hypothetical protein